MSAVTAVEEQQAAKAAKAAAKAAEEAKAAERQQGTEVLVPLTEAVLAARDEYLSTDAARNAAHLSLGFRLLAVEEVLVKFPALDLSVESYCRTNVPEVSGPVFGSSPAYRALQAARVASVVKADVGATSTDALRVLHRVKDVPGAATKVFKAAKTKAGRNRRVTGSVMSEVLEDLYPKDPDKSPGPKTGSAPKAAPKTRNTPTEGPSEVPDMAISGSRLKSAATRVGTLLQAGEEANPLFVAAGIVKCCEDYGIGATKAAVAALQVPTKAAAKTRTTKTRTTKTTTK